MKKRFNRKFSDTFKWYGTAGERTYTIEHGVTPIENLPEGFINSESNSRKEGKIKNCMKLCKELNNG